MAIAIHLQASLVVPLNHAFQRFAIFHHENHRRLGLHLFHVVEIFGVGLVRRGDFLLVIVGRTSIHLVFHFIQRRTDQLTIPGLHGTLHKFEISSQALNA